MELEHIKQLQEMKDKQDALYVQRKKLIYAGKLGISCERMLEIKKLRQQINAIQFKINQMRGVRDDLDIL